MNDRELITPSVIQPEQTDSSGEDFVRTEEFLQPIRDENAASELIENASPLVKELLEYLNSLSETDVVPDGCNDNKVDLYTVFSELAAMKTELKHASRHMKTGLEDFKSVFLTLQNCNDTLVAEIEQRKALKEQQINAEITVALKPQLVHLIELYDRVEMGVLCLTKYKPNILTRLFAKRAVKILLSQREGQQMLLSRIEQQLARNGVVPVNALGLPFDARLMCAIGTKTVPNKPNGIVLEEIRRGYLWHENLLRNSEVIVNKWGDIV